MGGGHGNAAGVAVPVSGSTACPCVAGPSLLASPAETGSNRGAVSAIGGNNGGTSDVAFSILQKKSAVGSGGGGGLAGLAGYGSDSEEEGGSGKAAASSSGVAASSGGSAGGGSKAPKEEDLVDFAKLACLLCQRQFPSGEKLQK